MQSMQSLAKRVRNNEVGNNAIPSVTGVLAQYMGDAINSTYLCEWTALTTLPPGQKYT